MIRRQMPHGSPGFGALVAIVFIAVAMAGTALAQQVVPSVSQRVMLPEDAPPPQILRLPMSKAHLVELPTPVRDVIVADPEIADVVVKTPTQVYIVARAVGSTNIFFVNGEGTVILHLVTEVDLDLDKAEAALMTLLPDENIELASINGNIVLSGTASSARVSADAAQLVRRFVEDDLNVINMIRVLAEQQVLLQVRIAEMSRNVLKNIGFNTSWSKNIMGRRNSILTATAGALNTVAGGQMTFNIMGLRDTLFAALERQGLVKTLAEPALTAVSGETANFLAGGEYPTPAGVDSRGNLIIEFREFGVSLSFTPVVLADNQINLRISTEVSRTDRTNLINIPIGGVTVPVQGLTVRRASSTVTLPSGASLMIAGLLQNDEMNDYDGMPGLMHLPILGALFRSHQFQSAKTEMVVMVTVYLVRPVGNDQPLTLPTDGFVPASEIDIYLFGRLFKQYFKHQRLDEIPTFTGPFGYIMK